LAASELRLPKEFNRISAGSFKCCTGLKHITIPVGISFICEDAFAKCNSLESIDFSRADKLTNLHSTAFYNCKSLKEIIIDKSQESFFQQHFPKVPTTSLKTKSNNTDSQDHSIYIPSPCTGMP